MQDNALIQLFLPIISTGLVAAGYMNIAVVASNQPTQQGVNTPATVYFFKVNDHRYGSVERLDTYDSVAMQMNHVETQIYETVFQVGALAIQDPTVISFTASDLVNSVAQILQSNSTLQTLSQSDVNIYRITDIRNPYFTDDKDRFEASPSFDFTLTHKQISTVVVPIAESVNSGIFRV